MTRFIERPSGLAVPTEKPTKPRRVYGPLEFAGGDKDVERALHTLWNKTRHHHLQSPEDQIRNKARRSVVRLAMDLFLRPDCEFEELC